MEKHPTLRLEDVHALTNAIGDTIAASLLKQDVQLHEAHLRTLDHEAIASGKYVADLAARLTDELGQLVAGRVSKQLATSVRIAREALLLPDGGRRWLHMAHKTAQQAFHKTLAAFNQGKASQLDMFHAQVTLAGIAQARGVLGIPIEAHERPHARNVRPFDLDDYPLPCVRAAIVGAAFNDDEHSINVLRSYAGNIPHDQDSQITVLLGALDSDDDGLRAEVAALAGRIVAHDKLEVSIHERRSRDVSVWVDQLSSTLTRRHKDRGRPAVFDANACRNLEDGIRVNCSAAAASPEAIYGPGRPVETT